MSSPKSLIYNCGASHVAAALFGSEGGKLVLEEFATQELRYDLSSEAGWLDALAAGVRGLIGMNPRLKGRATFVLPGSQLITKPIKVPHVEAGKQQQIIAFEAQNNMPLPLAEVVWGSQIIADDGVETEVVLIAQKADQALRFCGLMASIGVQPIALQPSSLLDYNSYKLAEGGDAEDTLMVDIGARSTNLTFISPAGLFVRSVNIGGNAFTQSIADALGAPFADAEELKVSFYSGQADFDATDPRVAMLQQKAQDFMKRLSQELTRSIVTYRRSSNRAAPQRIMLTGRAALLAGLPEFLSEAQKVSVDYFNPMSPVQLGGNVDQGTADRAMYQVSEVVGEASRLVIPKALGVNLLPVAIRERLVFERQKPILVLAAFCLALAPLPALLMYYMTYSSANTDRKQATQLNTKFGNLVSQIEGETTKAKDTSNEIAQYQGLINSRFNWIMFFSSLQDALAKVKDVWVDELKVVRQRPPAPVADANAGPASGGNATTTMAAEAPPPTYTLLVKGRMLVRAGGNQDASQRVHSLTANLKDTPFVKSVDDQSLRLDLTDSSRIIGFSFNISIDPDKPL